MLLLLGGMVLVVLANRLNGEHHIYIPMVGVGVGITVTSRPPAKQAFVQERLAMTIVTCVAKCCE